MEYWIDVFRRAAHKAAQDDKLDTLAMIVVFGQLLLSVVFWFLYNYTWPSGTITTRLLATAAPFLLFPVAFIVRFIGVPPELAKENAAHLASLENFAIPNQRRKEIKDTMKVMRIFLAPIGRATQKSLRSNGRRRYINL
jgi:hypothetical protein